MVSPQLRFSSNHSLTPAANTHRSSCEPAFEFFDHTAQAAVLKRVAHSPAPFGSPGPGQVAPDPQQPSEECAGKHADEPAARQHQPAPQLAAMHSDDAG